MFYSRGYFSFLMILFIILALVTPTMTPVAAQNQAPPTPPAKEKQAQVYNVHLPLIQRGSNNGSQMELQLPPDDPERGMIYAGLERNMNGPCRFAFQLQGTDFCTHGPDPAPRGVNIRQRTEPLDFTGRAAQEAVAVCDSDGVSGNRVQVMYVRAADKPDRYNQYVASIRSWANGADQIYYDSAVEVGSPRRIRFVHDANCIISVLNVVLTASGDDSFSNTVNQLVALNYNQTNRKYMIFMDANLVCGVGSYISDDSAGAGNSNNFGPSYGRTDNGCWDASTPAHELNHNLGGVQDSAPNSSLGGHCVDEYDVMCYSDEPYYPAMQTICNNEAYADRLDCNHNDYYHPNPPAGSYLATHWNTANNQFLFNPNSPPSICTIYTSTDVPKAIPDLGTVTSTLAVADVGTLTDVNVKNLRISHTYNSDLKVYLISPAGTEVELFTNVGQGSSNFIDTALDDSSLQLIANGAAPFTGTYRPEGWLNAFSAENQNGTWQLRVSDGAAQDTGQLTAWSLELCRPATGNASITLAVDAQPNHSQNFRFTGTLNGAFYLDDDAGTANADAVYNNAVTVSKPAGSYTAIATAYTNWFLTGITCTPSSAVNVTLASRTVTINATAGASINCTFTQQRASTVRAVKYNDINNSGARNSTEPYLSGWTMTLYDAQNNLLASGVTDTNGRVDFSGRLPGAYKVCETLTAGWSNTQPRTLDPVLGKPCRTVTTQPGATATLNFGNRAIVAAAQGSAASQETMEDSLEGITMSIEEEAWRESPEEVAP